MTLLIITITVALATLKMLIDDERRLVHAKPALRSRTEDREWVQRVRARRVPRRFLMF